MTDPTEIIRKELVQIINSAENNDRSSLEKKYGQVWNTAELSNDFTVSSFLAPFTIVIRKSDNKKGTLTFQHSPRFYFDFQEI